MTLFIFSFLIQLSFTFECSHEFVASTEVIQTKSSVLVFKVKDETIDIYSMQTEPSFQRKGHASFLFEEMLRRTPRATRIQALLMYDNLSAWLQANGTCSARFHRTPLGKIAMRFGFPEVIECELTSSGVWVVIGKAHL